MMTITLELPSETEDQIRALAAQAGVLPDELFRRVFTEWLASGRASAEPANKPGGRRGSAPRRPTGADLVAYWKSVGALGGFEDRPDSPEWARQLRSEGEASDRA
jgi:hypothetical protein